MYSKFTKNIRTTETTHTQKAHLYGLIIVLKDKFTFRIKNYLAKRSAIFFKTIKNVYTLLTTNACLAPARPHALHNHVGKVMRDVGRSTDPVFTKRAFKESQMAINKKKVKQRCRIMLKLEEKMRWSFSPYTTFLN